MNALAPPPPFPTNPQPGDVYCGWTWTGSQWVCTQGQGIIVQTFTVSGSYLPSPSLITAVVETIGGGAAGGPCFGNMTTAGAGGGGGSGGYSRKALAASMVRGGVLVTIGAGGDGAIASSGTAAANGNPTTFGALCVANGGGQGQGNNMTTVFGEAGAGAAAGFGDVAFPGNWGTPGTAYLPGTVVPVGFLAYQGIGGSLFGGGETISVGAQFGAPGFPGPPNTGAGGSGAMVNETSVGTAMAGGAGGSGLCIVTEYCFADLGGGCGGQQQGMARVAIPSGGPWAHGQGGWDND